MSLAPQPRGLRLKLPATSANLGPGFDAIGLALSMHLTVEAHTAAAFGIEATGRNADLCAALDDNLILDTYRDVLTLHGKTILPLNLKLHNEIPLGMGCGSSAAALLAGVALADHFGELHLGEQGIVSSASRLEGHPDNVAACWWGGFTTSAMTEHGVETAVFPGDPAWQLLLALPATSLSTKAARALLPDTYSRADAIFNVQRSSLLVAAFARQDLTLLRTAMQDRLHQPYRAEVCLLLKALLPLASEPPSFGSEIAGVALSGAGPSVLLILATDATLLSAEARLATLLGDSVELLPLSIGSGAERTFL